MTGFSTAPRPIRSVLVANRGEIACRVAATCRRLGLRAIAVHSEADAHARHVRLADDAYLIGPAPSAESYLDIDRIIDAARRTGADAIHPGYGFLSENPRFARAVEEAGLIFVGPASGSVEAMGSKINARRIAEEAGVPVVPGFDGEDASDDELAAAAGRIGYPLFVKASAGGGGRGMRRVMTPDDLQPALRSARAEAASAFGDTAVFLERLVLDPRHLEVQIFGDGKGGAVHFHERDCSVQRNHQKVIEEAPAPNLPDDVRQALYAHSVRLASAISYAGAGTVEFVMQAGENRPYFLEMNTRLQVEHPVTEEICGVDLVEWQLRQAAGLPLPFDQARIVPKGHAVEVRLNAERPESDFLPDTGRIKMLVTPSRLRFETGVEAGDVVPPYYDSTIAKLVAYGPDRGAALERLIEGIDRTALIGVGTNLGFLRDCLTTPVFAEGRATTGFLAENFPDGWRPNADALLRLRGQAALAATGRGGDPMTRADGFRVGGPAAPGRAPLQVEDGHGRAELVLSPGAAATASAEDRTVNTGGTPTLVELRGDRVWIADRGLSIVARVRPLAEARVEARADMADEGLVAAPLTGLVTGVYVSIGDRVEKGTTVAEMEAMKLVHSLVAPFDGIVSKLSAAAGQSVGQKTVLMEIVEEGS